MSNAEDGVLVEESAIEKRTDSHSTEVVKVDEKNKDSSIDDSGYDAAIPFSDGFAVTLRFWRIILTSSSIAVILAFISIGYFNCVDQIPKKWATCDYSNNRNCGDWNSGELYWIGISGGSGFIIGLIKYIFQYPDNLAGLFEEISTGYVHPEWSPIMFILSIISLSGGATLGPELALTNIGGGLCTYVAYKFIKFEFADDRKFIVLCGIASIIATIMTPMLALVFIHELSHLPGTYMESISTLIIPATVCWVIYYGILPYTYEHHISSSTAFIGRDWTAHGGYKPWMITTGLLIGVVSFGLSLILLITIGICKQFFQRLRKILSFNKFLKAVVPPMVGGVIIGLTNWALPLTVGKGDLVIGHIVKFGAIVRPKLPLLDRNLLISTGFLRMVLLGVSMQSGFVGGIIFPIFTIGIIAGVVMNQIFPYISLGFCICPFMVAIASAIAPLPITFTMLSATIFYLGIYELVPVFTACMTAYILMSGSGLLKNLARGANRRSGVPNNGEQGFVRMSFSFKKFRNAILTTDAFVAPENNVNGDNRYEVKANDADNNDRDGNSSIDNGDNKVVELESQAIDD